MAAGNNKKKMTYYINHNSGSIVATTKRLQYDATLMGDAYVSCDIDAPAPISWQIGDYIQFRGQRFVMTVLPSVTRNARDNSRGDAVQYKSVRFQCEAIAMMQDTMMLDYVTDDNNLHYTSLPTFQFYCSDDTITFDQEGQAVQVCAGLEQLADRIMANVKRAFPYKVWRIVIEPGTIIKPQSISVSNASVWNTLADACQKLGINFTVASVRNDDEEEHPDTDPTDYSFIHTITLGAIVHEIDNEFRYGKELGISQGAGLMKIERTSDENQQLITRLYAYGSTRNMPYRYYNNLPNVDDAMYLPNLMLPMFRQNGKVAYIDSPNAATLGIKEGVKFFDGSDSEVEDIYPSIAGMTTLDIYNALTEEQRTEQNIRDPQQYPSWDQGAVDEIVTAEQVTFDGIIPEKQTTAPTFQVTIKNIGFDPNEQIISGETPRMVFNSGMLAGRECNIRTMQKIAPTTSPSTYRVTLEVAQDTSINQYFPNVNYQVSAGDKFVLAGIRMPDTYVTAAEQRLQTAAEQFLALNDHTAYNYALTIDNIYMARHQAIAEQLMAGTKLHIVDNSLGIDERITISQIKITVGEETIPQYEITLSDTVEPSLLQRTTVQATQQAVQTMDAISTANTNRIIERINQLSKEYISKQGKDKAAGPVSFISGLFAGTDGAEAYANITANEMAIMQTDRQQITPTIISESSISQQFTGGHTYSRYAQQVLQFSTTDAATMHVRAHILALPDTPTSEGEVPPVIEASLTAVNDTDNNVLYDQQVTLTDGMIAVTLDMPPGIKQYTLTFNVTFRPERTQNISIGFSPTPYATEDGAVPNTAMKLTPQGLYRLNGATWQKVV